MRNEKLQSHGTPIDLDLRQSAPDQIVEARRTEAMQNADSDSAVERKKHRQLVKAAIAFTCGSTILVLFFALSLASHPERGRLLSGTFLSLMIGLILGYLPFWTQQRRADKRSLLVPFLLSCSIASGLMILFYRLLGSLYSEGIFHAILVVGLIAGAFFAATYSYLTRYDDPEDNRIR